jgi:ABC-2 type transport system ATP-binding protein
VHEVVTAPREEAPPPLARPARAIVSIEDVRKVYASGFEAVKGVSLAIEEGEILAMLGPNGAGKTTLISMTCGITSISAGRITVGGHDVVADYRRARELIGLMPQEVHLEIFETVANTVRYTRGLFGKPRDDAYLEALLTRLSLWEKRDSQIKELSGGMMRRVLIAKALSHQPRVLFLDEPTAGVDVELRKGMWEMVRELRAGGATIILTTHYIEEAQAMADRVAVINHGRILLVEDKATLMRRMGRKRMTIELQAPLAKVPEALAPYRLTLGEDGKSLEYAYDREAERTGIARLLGDLSAAGLTLRDVHTRQDSLEDIFVGLVRSEA